MERDNFSSENQIYATGAPMEIIGDLTRNTGQEQSLHGGQIFQLFLCSVLLIKCLCNSKVVQIINAEF